MEADFTGGLNSLVTKAAEPMYGMDTGVLQKKAKIAGATMDGIVVSKALQLKQQAKSALEAENQPNPDTIVAQNEKALMDGIKQDMGSSLGELTKQTAGTLNTKNVQQKKNMQRMAQGSPQGLGALAGGQRPQARPQPRPQPQGAGLANARMMQAAQGAPVRRMAQGGIVGFAEGGKTNKELGFGGRARARIEDLGITKQQFDAMNADQKQKIVQLINDRNNMAAFGNTMAIPFAVGADALSAPSIFAKNAGNYLAETRVGQALGLSDPAQGPAERIPYGGVTSALQDRANTNLSTLRFPAATLSSDQLSNMLPAGTPPVNPNMPPPQTGATPFGPNSPVPTPALPAPAPAVTKDITPSAGGLGGLAATPQVAGTVAAPDLTTANRTNVDEAVQAGFAQADANSNRDERVGNMEERLAALDKYDSEAYRTPEEQSRREIQSFLVGMGGTGSLGAAMRGGFSAMSKEENRSRANGRRRLMDKFNAESKIATTDKDFSQLGLTLATQLAANAQNNENNVRNNVTNMTMAQMRQATADADRLVTREKTLFDKTDKEASREIERAKNENYDRRTRLNSATKVMDQVADIRFELRDNMMASNQRLIELNFQLGDAEKDNDAEKMAQIEAEIQVEQGLIDVKVNKAINDQGLLEMESTARAISEELMDPVKVTSVKKKP